MIASVSLAGYWVDTSKFYDFMFIYVSGMLLFFFRLSFFSSLAYLLQSSSCSICVYIYVPHFFWTPIWWTMYSREIINTDCHFWFRKRSVLRPLETDPTHGLIVVYIYIRLSGPKKEEIKIMLSPIFQVTLKKHAHVQVPIYLQIKCRCN